MSGPLLVSACDANLYWLVKGLVLSTAAARRDHALPMVLFDLGLAPAQAAWLRAQDVGVLPPADPLGIAGREGFKDYMLGQACRPFLPDLLPGHDAYIWLDADTWIQQPDAIGGLLHIMRHGRAACCPEVHASYPVATGLAPTVRRFWLRHWGEVYGAEAAERYASIPMINSGVVAAPAGHGIWARWQAEFRRVAQRPLTHFSEQFAFFRAALVPEAGGLDRAGLPERADPHHAPCRLAATAGPAGPAHAVRSRRIPRAGGRARGHRHGRGGTAAAVNRAATGRASAGRTTIAFDAGAPAGRADPTRSHAGPEIHRPLTPIPHTATMQVALVLSVQGMQRAGERLAQAAEVIASPVRGADPSPAPPTGSEGLTAAQASGAMEGALVDAILARRAYEANARAFESNARTERALFSRGA